MYLSFIPFTEFASTVTEIVYFIQYQFTVTSNLQITAYCKMTCLLLCIIWKNVCCLIYRCTSVIFSDIQWWFHWWHIELVMYFIRLLFLITLLSIHHAAWIIFGWVSGQKEKKRKESSLFDFPRRILSRIVSLLQCVAGSARWNPCQPCHLIPGQPQNPSELYEHKAVMNLSPPVILSGAAGSLSSQSGAVAASCAQPGFPFCSLSPKTKRVVSMLSENYSVQDVSPFISSYVESHFSS